MKIGIVIAIARELKAFLESDYEIETINEGAKEVYKTTITNKETKEIFVVIMAENSPQINVRYQTTGLPRWH